MPSCGPLTKFFAFGRGGGCQQTFKLKNKRTLYRTLFLKQLTCYMIWIIGTKHRLVPDPNTSHQDIGSSGDGCRSSR